MSTVVDKGYIAVDGFFAIGGWLNAQSLDIATSKMGLQQATY